MMTVEVIRIIEIPYWKTISTLRIVSFLNPVPVDEFFNAWIALIFEKKNAGKSPPATPIATANKIKYKTIKGDSSNASILWRPSSTLKKYGRRSKNISNATANEQSEIKTSSTTN